MICVYGFLTITCQSKNKKNSFLVYAQYTFYNASVAFLKSSAMHIEILKSRVTKERKKRTNDA